MIVEARLTGFFSTGYQPEKVYVKHKICTSFHSGLLTSYRQAV